MSYGDFTGFTSEIIKLYHFNNDIYFQTGVEATENSPAAGCERWTVFAMKELASSLQISEGNNWKTFAKHIGFTKSEIKNKLSFSSDPFLALMNMYNSRGGTPEEFIQVHTVFFLNTARFDVQGSESHTIDLPSDRHTG